MSEGMGQKKAEAKKGFKAGFVAIIGRPNAGKSTLRWKGLMCCC